MAIPRVFISSTCYDLKHVRESLKYFIRTIGYEPVLSDDGDVFYNPTSHTHDSCLKEVATCQLFVLIIGGKHGGNFKDGDSSITNNEYKEAIKNNVSVFALVESSVHSDHHVFNTNKKNQDIIDKIQFPSIDNVKIFDFIDEVRKSALNNAIFPFRNFSDIESYLRKQWAGMMYEFLGQQNNEKTAKITNRLLDDLSLAARKSEELMKILLKTTTTADADAVIKGVNDRIEAINFVRLIFDSFAIAKLEQTTLDDLETIELNKSWVDFLLDTKDFSKEELPNTAGYLDAILFGPSGRGLKIGGYIDNEFMHDSYTNLERAYKALKEADMDLKHEVFYKLVNGF